ncbi:uncharacterized protein LOC119067247 isoform X2 [Bradysia coprophila]|uniref:uncharacterized protein LOC119067247 isoform X2 n=1 Tax=Bradysia coprophila TaxID=38358 RepID=UPI00187DB05C|nr:uncharacterized protein LOC119067247 isoform X2 [Bradysia coprophila]
MVSKCSVLSCNINSDKKAHDVVSFFEFPSTPTRKQNWLDSIGRSFFKPLRSSRVCSQHFDGKYLVRTGNEVVLKKDAVPFSLNSARKSTHRLTLNSSRSSDENVLLNNNKRGQDTSMTPGPSIGVKRPRRNLANLANVEEQSPEEPDNTIRRQRRAVVILKRIAEASDAQQNNSASKRPKTGVPLISKNQPSVEKRSTKTTLNASKGSDGNVLLSNNKQGRTANKSEELIISEMRPRRNTVFMGPYNFGIRNRAATSTSQNQSSIEQRSTEKSFQRKRKTAVAAVLTPNEFGKENQVAASTPGNQRQRNSVTTPNNVDTISVVRRDTPRPYRLSTESKNQFSVEERSSIQSNLMIQQQPVTSSNNGRALMPISMNQLSIDKFFSKKATSISQQDVIVEPEALKREDCVFGWTLIGPHAVPYILHNSEKFCSLRILEKSALAKYKKRTTKIGECSENVEYFPLSLVQCELLNEINFKHCDGAYGKERFSMKDKLVRLSDACKYYTFVDLCHQPLMKGIRVQSDGLEFGFTLVNKKSFIPYVLLRERKYIPLRYLHCDERVFDLLKGKSRILSDDDALYLKFCCKFERNSKVYDDLDDDIEVIDFAEIRQLAPPKTKFTDCWPADKINYTLQLVMTVTGIRFESVRRNAIKELEAKIDD